jgi:small subunit ribosomal protein S17
MAEEEKKDQEEQEEPQAEAPAEDAAAQEAPAEEAPAEEPAEEAPAEEAEEAPAGAEGEESTGDSAEDDDLGWKTRKRLERSRRPSEARPQQSPEDRQNERKQRRGARAVARQRHRQRRRAKKGEPRTGTPRAEHRANPAKVRQGIVVSDGADKTITVRIDIARRHPTYEKIVRRSRTLRAHDEGNEAGAGDVVRVIETRPISRSKRWRLLEVVEKAR